MYRYVEEVTLRAPEPEDLDIMMELENSMSLMEVSTSTGPYSRYQLKRYIEESQNDIYIDRQLRLMIVHCTEGVVGMVDLCTFDPRHNRAEVGIIVHPDMREQKIGSRALALLEEHCFRVMGIKQLYAYVCKANKASMALFRSMDYRKCGTLHDWVRIGNEYYDVCMFQKFCGSYCLIK